MRPWASASQTTLRGEQPGPARHQERATSPQEVVAGLRHDLVHHVKRASPSGATRPWPPVSTMPASQAHHGWNAARGGARAMSCIATALQGNLPSPVGRLGSRRERTGQPATRPLHHAACVFHTAHGKLLSGGSGRWTGGRGRPRTTSRCLRGVADGAVEAEDGHAVHTGMSPHGAGPSPWECWRMRSYHAKAQAEEASQGMRHVSSSSCPGMQA